LPGRAWDSKGVFIDQSVAINHLVDYIRSLKPENKKLHKLFIFANGYLKGDYMMMEKPFLGVGTYKRWFPLLKYYIGPRPATTHGHGYLFKETIPNWREKTTEEFKKIMSRISTYVIFNCFKYATFSTSHTINYGVPQTVYILPELIEVVRAGWQAEIPLEIDSGSMKIYSARYGKDINSYFFLGNPYPQACSFDVKADCSYLGNVNYLPVRKMRKNAETQLKVNKRKVCFNVNLPPRIPYLYETVCGISPTTINYKCQTSSKKDINKQIFKVKFTPEKPFEAKFYFKKIRNFKLASVCVDGKKIVLNNRNAVININKNTTVTISYKSEFFQLTQKQLLAFPFVDARKFLNFKINVPENASAEELDAAEMLKKYFIFCSKKYVIDGKSPTAEIIKSSSIPAQDNWIAISRKAENSIKINNNVLYIQGENLKELVKSTEYVMDNKFRYDFPFRGSMGLYNYQLKHFKMYGKTLPYVKYFEGEK
jgi:hypothetical protein